MTAAALAALVAGVAAVTVMVVVAAYAAPRLRTRSAVEDKRRALTVLFTGLTVAAVLTIAAIGARVLVR